MKGINVALQRERSNARVRKWRAAHPERLKAERAAYNARRKLDPVYMEEQRSRFRVTYAVKFANNPEAIRKQNLQQKYGLTLEAYDAMLKAQGGVCAICGTDKPGGRGNKFNVDHDHETDAVRALLCNRCNKGLGFFRDSPDLLVKAACYLKKFISKVVAS